MLPANLPQQLPYFISILVLFIAYGVLVRRGVITGKGIIWSGLGIGAAAVLVSFINSYRTLPPGAPLPLLLLNPFAMAIVTLYCVSLTYRAQRVEEIGTHSIGDTKILLRVCLPNRIPDADALLLPTSTLLRMAGGLAGQIGFGAGTAVDKAVSAHAPVGIGKVVETDGGKLAVGHIYHVAVHAPLKDVPAVTLRKGIEAAAIQARKGGAESLVVPLGPMRGLTTVQSMEAIIEGTLKHRKAFAEIVFVAFDSRTGGIAQEAVARLVSSATPENRPTGRPSDRS